MAECARRVYRAEGLKAFYVSYPTTLCMTVPFTALQFMAYESISKVMNPPRTYDPATHCVAGGLAGGFAAGLTTPLDVIKTLLQTRGSAQDLEIRSAKGLWQAAAIIKNNSGWAGFFRGWRPRIITAMPSTAICWFVPCHQVHFAPLTAGTGARTRWLNSTSTKLRTACPHRATNKSISMHDPPNLCTIHQLSSTE